MAESAERLWVKTMYPGSRWANKVDRMSDAQVHAIYVKQQHKLKENR